MELIGIRVRRDIRINLSGYLYWAGKIKILGFGLGFFGILVFWYFGLGVEESFSGPINWMIFHDVYVDAT